ncbi:MAG: photosynthetic complex putative assembly protein PuhB [Pseudomonadota bacterium]
MKPDKAPEFGHDDFAFEPVPGLPERLPKGEHILWQGRPSTWALARDALSVRVVAGYFVLLAAWRAIVVGGEASVVEALIAGSWLLAVGLVACGLLWVIALSQARAALYTITNKRVVMRVGAALNVTFNLPFRQIETAAADLRKDGTGTIALTLSGRNRISYLICWPHVRPWRMARCEPALRCIPDAEAVATILAEAAQNQLAQPVIERIDASVSDHGALGVPAE